MLKLDHCKKCVHDVICAFKFNYEQACKSIEELSYPIPHLDGTMKTTNLEESGIHVSIKCPYFLKENSIMKCTDNDISP